MTTTTVASHWMHHRFVNNLVNASHDRDLHGAAKEWKFFRLHAAREMQSCQLCNTRIVNCVTLQNTENGNYLVLGENCYDKLLSYLRSGRVKSTLPSRDAQTRKLRRHWKVLLKNLKDRTVVGWFREELQAGRLPADITEIVYTISRIGLAPTTGDADRVIAFYKATRRFPIEALLAWYELRDFSHRKLLPTSITIEQIDRVQAIITRGRKLIDQLRRLKWQSSERERWTRLIKVSIDRLNIMHMQLTNAAELGIERATAPIPSLTKVIDQLKAFNPETYDLESLERVALKFNRVAERTIVRYQWYLKNPETILVVLEYGRRYVLAKRHNHWQRLKPIDISYQTGIDHETGLYSAVVLDDQSPVKVQLIERWEANEAFKEVDFSVPSKKIPGTYVAMMNGKVVLPSASIRTPGTYFAFIMNDAGRYYRAWVL